MKEGIKMTSKKNTAKKETDFSTYKFDTSAYIIINTDVRRDEHTGRLIYNAKKPSKSKKLA